MDRCGIRLSPVRRFTTRLEKNIGHDQKMLRIQFLHLGDASPMAKYLRFRFLLEVRRHQAILKAFGFFTSIARTQ